MIITPEQEDALIEISNIGMSKAAKQLSPLLNSPIKITIPNITIMHLIENAVKLPTRIRKKLEKLPSHGSVNTSITCSGGLAYWKPSDPPISAEKLIDQADIQLYKAKKSGRNCIFMADNRL